MEQEMNFACLAAAVVGAIVIKKAHIPTDISYAALGIWCCFCLMVSVSTDLGEKNDKR